MAAPLAALSAVLSLLAIVLAREGHRVSAELLLAAAIALIIAVTAWVVAEFRRLY